MQELFPYLLNGVSVGGQYALIAIGYTLVYGILRLINFAHGDVFMVAGLVMVYATTAMPMYLAIPLVLVATVLTILPELLRAFSDYRMLVYAIVLILVMLLTNSPILSNLVSRLYPRLHRRSREKGGEAA